MKDWKNIITTICGWISLAGVVLGVVLGVLTQYAVTVPVWLAITAGVCVALPVAVIGWCSGRNADLSKKSDVQIDQQKKMTGTGI